MKNNLSKRFQTASSREEKGIWVNFGDGIRVRVRRFRSRYVLDAKRDLEKPYAHELRRGPLPDDVQEDLAIRLIARAVIADWEGIVDDDGNAIPASEDNKLEIIRALPEFRDEVFQVSIARDPYLETANEDGEGN